jgi:hypothetical protein
MTATLTEGARVGASDELKVRGNTDHIVFKGYLLAELVETIDSAEEFLQGRPARWTDLYLYAVTHSIGQYRYVLQVVMRSLVYHAVDGCSRGVKTTVERIKTVDPQRYQDLEPCTKCEPGDVDKMEDTDRICVERDVYFAYECPTAGDVVDHLTKNGRVTAPGGRLLGSAALLDPAFDEAMLPSRKI